MAEKKISRQHVIAKLLIGAVYFDDEGYWQVLSTTNQLSFLISRTWASGSR